MFGTIRAFHGPLYPDILSAPTSTHTSTGPWNSHTSPWKISSSSGGWAGSPSTGLQLKFTFNDSDEVADLFSVDENSEPKSTSRPKCTCDYDTVIRVKGCQCGGR